MIVEKMKEYLDEELRLFVDADAGGALVEQSADSLAAAQATITKLEGELAGLVTLTGIYEVESRLEPKTLSELESWWTMFKLTRPDLGNLTVPTGMDVGAALLELSRAYFTVGEIYNAKRTLDYLLTTYTTTVKDRNEVSLVIAATWGVLTLDLYVLLFAARGPSCLRLVRGVRVEGAGEPGALASELSVQSPHDNVLLRFQRAASATPLWGPADEGQAVWARIAVTLEGVQNAILRLDSFRDLFRKWATGEATEIAGGDVEAVVRSVGHARVSALQTRWLVHTAYLFVCKTGQGAGACQLSITDWLLSERVLQSCVHCPWLLRHAVALALLKRTGNRALLAVLANCDDEIAALFRGLFQTFQATQEHLRAVTTLDDWLLRDLHEEVVAAARLTIFEHHCLTHQVVKFEQIANKLGLSQEQAEAWLTSGQADERKQTGGLDSFIDGINQTLEMVPQRTSVHLELLEKTKNARQRTQLVLASFHNNYQKQRRTPRVKTHV